MISIKLCGMTRREDIIFAAKLGVNALGFILAKSPRQVSIDDAKAISSGLPPFIAKVGVVVNPDHNELERIIKSRVFDYIQFHGDEDPELIKDIPLKSIKAISISEAKDLEKLERYRDVDYILFDTKLGKQKGGTGEVFNWDFLRDISYERPFILAGGLGPDNIISAITTVRPAAVDINSRVEKSPGIKDPVLLKDTILKIRRRR
jgi:phosphoribosylanthranilate isomerase